MATITQPLRSSKRKRAQVKYYESESDERDFGGYDDDDENVPSDDEPLLSSKKVKGQTPKPFSNKPLPKKNIFPFALLPAELKNHIYQLTLTTPEPIFLVSRTKAYRRTVQREIMTAANASGTNRRARYRHFYQSSQPSSLANAPPITTLTPLIPNLLLLNKETYAEAQPFLYGSNDFIVEDTTALHAFLANIRPRNVATLTDLTINGWGYTKAHKIMNSPALTLLASAANLKRLFIDCTIHYNGPNGAAKQLFRDGHHWFEGVGAAAIEAVEMNEDNFNSYKWRNNSLRQPTQEEGLAQMKEELRRLLKA